MKVLVITNLYPNKIEPTRGIYNKQLVDELAKLCELKVVAPVLWVPKGKIFARLSPFRDIPAKELIDNIQVYHPGYFITPKIGRLLYGLYFFLSLYGIIKRLRKEFKFDIIFAAWVYPDGVGSFFIAKKLKVPIVIEALGSDINTYTKFVLRKNIISKALCKADKVIAVSNELKSAIIKIGVPEKNIQVVSNGVNGNIFSYIDRSRARKTLYLPQETKIILFVGNLVPVKGIDYLIESYKKVASQVKDARLIIIGGGYLKNSLESKIKKYYLNVTFYGKIPHEKISLWMNASDVLCVPSLNEGCPNVVLEAMACGTMIVASRVGGIPELVNDYARVFLVEPKNIDQLSMALGDALTKFTDEEKSQDIVCNRPWKNAAEEIFAELNKVQGDKAQVRPTNEFRYPVQGEYPLKVLIITNLFPNGQEQTRGIFNKQQFIALAKLCDLRVVAPLPWYSKIKVAEKEVIDSITTYHPRYIMTPKIWRSLYGFFFYFSLLNHIKQLYTEFPFDVILATWAYPDAFGSYLIAKKLNKPIVIKVHGSDINTYASSFLRKNMILRALSNSKRVIAVSKALKEEMIKIGVAEEKIAVISNGVDLNLFKPMDRTECRNKLNLPLHKKIILFVGNLVPVKGIDVLLKAFSILACSRDDVVLVIVGDGLLESRLRKEARKSGIEQKVIFAGRKTHVEISYYINSCDFFCLPSRSEGCPNVVLESMACGRPVVSTRVGCIEELIRKDDLGILVKPENITDLAEALSKALKINWDSQKSESLPPSFSWADSAKRIFEIVKTAAVE